MRAATQVSEHLKPDPTVSNAQSATEFAERRDFAHRSVKRANRAVMVILVVAFLLGVAMVAASYRALQSQRLAEFAEGQATERLWNASLAQARAERLGTAAGHRGAALTALSNAAAIRPSATLRDEAIASLGLRDLVREVSWPLEPGAYGFYFDPDLEFYIVRYAPDELSMFRLKDNSLVRTFRASDAGLGTNAVLTEFHFTATGRHITTQYRDGVVVLWERASGRVARAFGKDPGSEKLAWRPTFSDGDTTMFARSASRQDQVLFIDIASGKARTLTIPGVNETARLNQHGDRFAWVRGKELMIHDSRTGDLTQSIQWPADVYSFRWDRAGRQISVWLADSTLNVWDTQTGRSRQLGGKFVGPWVQQFSPDGTLLATAGHDGTSRLWDVTEARLLAETTEARAFVFGNDGERIAFAIPGREVGIWRITKPTGYRVLQGVVGPRATVWYDDLSPDGRWHVWEPPRWMNRPGFELFDLAAGRPSLWVAQENNVRAGFHPTEPRLVVAGQEGLLSYPLPTTNATPLKLGVPERLPLPDGFVPQIFSFSANGRRAVVVNRRGDLCISDQDQPGQFVMLEPGMKQGDLPGPASRTGGGGIAMSPNGRWVVAGRDTSSGGPIIWDAQTGATAHHLDAEPGHVAFSPDGRWLATIGTTACSVWSVGDWKLKWRRPRTLLLTVMGAAAFSADGSLLAWTRSLDEIELAEPSTGEHVALVTNPSILAIPSLRLSADASLLTASGADGRIHTWDLTAIRGELAKLNLDWSSPIAMATPALTSTRSQATATPPLLPVIGLGAVGLAGVLGIIVLRRHGRLTEDYIHTTELASRQARELAAERELNELKTRFVSMVSHEFRTPLGITMSAIELLRNYLDRLDSAKRKELFDDIFNSTRHMASLMEQVLLLGRVEAGKLAFRPAPIDLVTLCEKLVDESQSATKRRCPIVVKSEDALGGAQADEPLLRHIFSNLLSNAVKYSPADMPVEFTIARNGRNVVFTVSDRGIGIPEAELPRLYQAFHRAGNVGETPGTGLGLVIVKRCVDLHGGSIVVKSRPGEGTAFTVSLPLFPA
jgi:signal transduction histidine kinase